MMNRSWKFACCAMFSLLGICVLLVITITAQAATYYVATTGNDANPGTSSQPFKSFKKGVSLLQPGDTLYIREGLYTEQIDLQTPGKSGTPTGWITIAGHPKETVTLQYTDPSVGSYGPIKARGNRAYFIFENLILDGISGTYKSGWSIRDGNHHFILRSLEIKNFHVSGLYISANDIQIINCRIHDQISDTGLPGNRPYGIYFHDGNNGLLEGNEIHSNPGGGVTIYPGPISNLVVRNNSFHHNNTLVSSAVEGIQVVQGPGTPISGVQIYNNLIYQNGVNQPDPGKSGGIRVANGATDTKIWNNTIYGNKGFGINIQNGVNGTPSNTVMQNNIVFGNTVGQIVDAGSGSSLSHNLTTDPKFVKPESFDFRPQLHSPAVDAGIYLIQVTTDFKNVTRPKGATHDIGAYEEDGSGIKSLAAPQLLGVQ